MDITEKNLHSAKVRDYLAEIITPAALQAVMRKMHRNGCKGLTFWKGNIKSFNGIIGWSSDETTKVEWTKR